MLETISALRTNNARKIPNYDPSLMEHMKKLLRGLLKATGESSSAGNPAIGMCNSAPSLVQGIVV